MCVRCTESNWQQLFYRRKLCVRVELIVQSLNMEVCIYDCHFWMQFALICYIWFRQQMKTRLPNSQIVIHCLKSVSNISLTNFVSASSYLIFRWMRHCINGPSLNNFAEHLLYFASSNILFPSFYSLKWLNYLSLFWLLTCYIVIFTVALNRNVIRFSSNDY